MNSKLHLHSMMVHAVAALVPVAAAAWLLATANVAVGRFGPGLWQVLTIASLAVVLFVAVPTTITGIGERDAMYVRWQWTHQLKLVLSVALMAAVCTELVILTSSPSAGMTTLLLGVLVVGVNNVVSFGLCALGLRITLGRQGLGAASYLPDMYCQPPVDILAFNAAFKDEPARIVDPRSEVREAE